MKMDTMFDIKLPTELTVKVELAKDVPVELVLERENLIANRRTGTIRTTWFLERRLHSINLGDGLEFVAAPDVPIPVNLAPDTLPYALLSRMKPSLLPGSSLPMASVSIRIIEKRNIRIRLKNLAYLKNLFGDDASLKLVLSHEGALKSWQTNDMTIHENESNMSETSIWISEDIEEILTQFGQRKRYRTAHGEVSSVTGNFTLLAKWTIKPRPKLEEVALKLDRHQHFIQSRPFDHTVDLVASNGKIFKVSKALLAAYSEKIERQLQFLMDEKTDAAKSYKAIKIYSGFTTEDGQEHCLCQDSLRALVKFVTMNSITEPLNNPALSLELMMYASYNMIKELEKSMALILLAQPLELHDIETSVYLFWFSSLKVDMYEEEMLKNFWERVRIRALWNFKGISREKLTTSQAFQELFPDESSRDKFFSLV